VKRTGSRTSGKVDIRTNQLTGKSRLRFYGAGSEQIETILRALSAVKLEFGTEHDTVALEALSLKYLSEG
jgi:hypothetical protein